MNTTNIKLDDVAKAFAALPAKGSDAAFSGKVKTNIDLNTHIQGLAPYRAFHLMTHSVAGDPAGRLLVVDRTPGSQKLVSEMTLPALSATKPFFFHAGGCQLIGDCLVIPAEDGRSRSVISFFDVSDVRNIVEVSPGSRIRRDFHEAGSVGVTNFSQNGKTFWLLCAYDNGATEFYLSADAEFPGSFRSLFSTTLDETEHQSLCLFTDVSDRVFAIGLHRTFLGQDMAILYSVDLAAKTMSVLTTRHFKTTGPDDEIGGGPHFRWGGGFEIVSATELGLFCSARRYDSGCHVNEFDSATRSLRAAVRPLRATRASARGKPRRRARKASRSKR